MSNEDALVNGSFKKQLTHDEWLEETIRVFEALMEEYSDRPNSEEFQAAKNTYMELMKEQRANRETSMKAMKNRAEVDELRERNKFSFKRWGMNLLGDALLGSLGVVGEAFGYRLPTMTAGFMSSIRRARTKD